MKSASTFICLYNSFAIFLFAALSLIIEGGYSYGPAMLVVGSLVLLFKKHSLILNRHDWLLIFSLLLYFFVNVFSNIYHHLPGRSYDRPLRFLLAVPVYLLLISYPPKKSFLFFGVIIGAIGAGGYSIYHRFFSDISWWAYGGSLNPIQFGDISLLLSCLSLSLGLAFIEHKKNGFYTFLILIAALMGVTASISSESRGGWLALPIVVMLLALFYSKKLLKKILYCLVFLMAVFVLLYKTVAEDHFIKKRVNHTISELIKSTSNDELVNSSVTSRLRMWKNGIKAFYASPLFGWGDLDSIKERFPLDWVELNKVDNFNHLHNEYIEELAKRGLVGFLSLMALYFISLIHFYSTIKKSPFLGSTPFAFAGVVLIACTMMFGLTQCFLAHNSGTTVFVFFLIAFNACCRDGCKRFY